MASREPPATGVSQTLRSHLSGRLPMPRGEKIPVARDHFVGISHALENDLMAGRGLPRPLRSAGAGEKGARSGTSHAGSPRPPRPVADPGGASVSGFPLERGGGTARRHDFGARRRHKRGLLTLAPLNPLRGASRSSSILCPAVSVTDSTLTPSSSARWRGNGPKAWPLRDAGPQTFRHLGASEEFSYALL